MTSCVAFVGARTVDEMYAFFALSAIGPCQLRLRRTLSYYSGCFTDPVSSRKLSEAVGLER